MRFKYFKNIIFYFVQTQNTFIFIPNPNRNIQFSRIPNGSSPFRSTLYNIYKTLFERLTPLTESKQGWLCSHRAKVVKKRCQRMPLQPQKICNILLLLRQTVCNTLFQRYVRFRHFLRALVCTRSSKTMQHFLLLAAAGSGPSPAREFCARKYATSFFTCDLNEHKRISCR